MRSLDEHIAYVESKIAHVAGKEDQYKCRRTKLEQKLKTLHKRREAQRNSLLLAALQDRIDNDPEELAKLQKTLDKLDLSDDQRALVGLPANDTRNAAAAVPDSGSDTPATTPRSPANSAGRDAVRALDPNGTPAAPPDSATDTADDEPSSPTNPVAGDAGPSQPKAPPSRATASAEPGDEPSEKQLKFIEDLLSKYPDKGQKIGVDSESLPTLSKAKASWVIKQLAPPRRSTPQTLNRR